VRQMDAIGIWGATAGRGDGIGRAVLETLTQDAATAAFAFGRSEAQVESLRNALPAVKGSLVWDLANEAAGEQYQSYLIEHHIQTVISAIGGGVGNPVPFLTRKEFGEMVDGNLMSAFMILKYSLLPMKQLGGGRIVLVGSIASFAPEEGACGYSATKMALRGMVEAVRRELKMGFQTISLHAVYPASVGKIGIPCVVDAVRYLVRLPVGVHSDVIIAGDKVNRVHA
jgi:NAD(P)-dependent dehydrogenase (short-subunit alcohol dehydrogenase family)